MSENFKKTVNLSKLNRTKQDSESFDFEKDKKNMHKINMPIQKKANEDYFKKVTIILLAVILLFLGYFLFFKPEKVNEEKKETWYMIKLVNDEVYYGRIENEKNDPIVVKNVYYNYNQEKKEVDNQNLKLKPRGNETYGPDGTMKIIRNQILYLEPLRQDSQVLQAIRDHEYKSSDSYED